MLHIDLKTTKWHKQLYHIIHYIILYQNNRSRLSKTFYFTNIFVAHKLHLNTINTKSFWNGKKIGLDRFTL